MQKILNNVCGFKLFKFDEFNINLANNGFNQDNGDIISLIGPSGSGKTSFFRGILIALLPYLSYKQTYISNDTLRYLNTTQTNGDVVKKGNEEKDYLLTFLDEMFNLDRSYILLNFGENLNLLMYPTSLSNYEYAKVFLNGDVNIIHKHLIDNIQHKNIQSIGLAIEALKKDGICTVEQIGVSLKTFYDTKDKNCIIGIGDKIQYENMLLLLLENMGDNNKIIDKTLLTTLAQELKFSNNKYLSSDGKSKDSINVTNETKQTLDYTTEIIQNSLIGTNETNEYYENIKEFVKSMQFYLSQYYKHILLIQEKANETNYDELITFLESDIKDCQKNIEEKKEIENQYKSDINFALKEIKNVEKEKGLYEEQIIKLKELFKCEDLTQELLDTKYTEYKVQLDLENAKKDFTILTSKMNEFNASLKRKKNELLNYEKELIIQETEKNNIKTKLDKKITYLFGDEISQLSDLTKVFLLSLEIKDSQIFNDDEIANLNEIVTILTNIDCINNKLTFNKNLSKFKSKFETINIDDLQKQFDECTNAIVSINENINNIKIEIKEIETKLNDMTETNFDEKKHKLISEMIDCIDSYKTYLKRDFIKEIETIKEREIALQKDKISLLEECNKLNENLVINNKELLRLKLEYKEIQDILTDKNLVLFNNLENLDDLIYDVEILSNSEFKTYIEKIELIHSSYGKLNSKYDIRRLIQIDGNLLTNDKIEFYNLLKLIQNQINTLKMTYLSNIDNFSNHIRTSIDVIERLKIVEKKQRKTCEQLVESITKTTKQSGEIKYKVTYFDELIDYIDKYFQFFQSLDELNSDSIIDYINRNNNKLMELIEKHYLLEDIQIYSQNECIINNKPIFIQKIDFFIKGSKGNKTALVAYLRNKLFKKLSEDIKSFVSIPMVIDESSSMDENFKIETIKELDYIGSKILLATSENFSNDMLDSILKFIPNGKTILIQQLKKIDGTLKC